LSEGNSVRLYRNAVVKHKPRLKDKGFAVTTEIDPRVLAAAKQAVGGDPRLITWGQRPRPGHRRPALQQAGPGGSLVPLRGRRPVIQRMPGRV